MTRIVFVGELPKRTPVKRRSKWDRVAKELKARPNGWFMIVECFDAIASGAKAQALRNSKAFMEPGFEVASRTSKGVSAVYARYSTERAEEQRQAS